MAPLSFGLHPLMPSGGGKSAPVLKILIVVVAAFYCVSLASRSLAEVNKAFACPKFRYFKSLYIKNPIFSSKISVPSTAVLKYFW